MLNIILLSGYKRSGKDHVASILKDSFDTPVTLMSFAEPLKQIMADTFDMPLDNLNDLKNADASVGIRADGYDNRFKLSVRSILQRFGTEAMKKQFGLSVWSELLITKLPEEGVVVITDWRFPEEYDSLSALENVSITKVRVNNYKILNTDTHSSEVALDNVNFDYYLDNTNMDKSINGQVKYFADLVKAKMRVQLRFASDTMDELVENTIIQLVSDDGVVESYRMMDIRLMPGEILREFTQYEYTHMSFGYIKLKGETLHKVVKDGKA